MTPAEFLKTIYLGDRACKSILLDGWNARVEVHVDVISRIRSPTGNWDHYAAEDIYDGSIVFVGVTELTMRSSGPLPNDLINDLRVVSKSTLDRGIHTFLLSAASVDESGTSTEVLIEIDASDVHLQDPKRPSERIRD